MSSTGAVPVTVLTGFLGSGKTTVLKRLLAGEEGRRTAVLVNEFGEISIDDLLVKSVSGNTVVLRNGCVCCSVRSELRDGLRDLLDARSDGALPPFDRVVIETTGLADPVPVVQTLVADPMLRHNARLASLVSTVDALNGAGQLQAFPEAARQAATADRLLITKTDLVTQEAAERLERVLSAINPTAEMARVCGREDLAAILFGLAADAAARRDGIPSWLRKADALPAGSPLSEHRRPGSIVSFVYRTDQPLDWTEFAVWLSLLVHRHGRNILRIKGLLDVPGTRGPVCLDVVQHFIHPPLHLDAWPDDNHESRLVFIVQDLGEAVIRDSLSRFLRRVRQEAHEPVAVL